MITAIVLIRSEAGQISATASKLSEMKEVAETYSVTGDWDLVAIIKVKEFEEVATVVTDGLAKLQGIIRTNTLIALRCYPQSLLERCFSVGMESAPQPQV